MKIALIGACDRNNYGDLLMPIIFIKQFQKEFNKNENIKFDVYSMKNSDLNRIKAMKTHKIENCYNNCDIAIIVGGDVLTVSYKTMLIHLINNKLISFIIRGLGKIFPNKTELFCKTILHGKTNKPWILNKNIINCKKIIYNTVGGLIDFNEENKENIKKATYISIRNKYDYNEIKKICKHARLYPDSITSISKIFNEDDFKINVSDKIKKICKADYFIFQINKKYGNKNEKTICEEIKKICKEKRIKCFLLPIGYANGHDDFDELKKIYSMLNHNDSIIFLNNELNIYETTYIIKESKMFMGTSLHGIIVSTSYKIPHFILTNKLIKLNNYFKTWKTSIINYSNLENIYENFCLIINNKKNQILLNKKSKELIDLSLENFNNINKIIIKGNDIL